MIGPGTPRVEGSTVPQWQEDHTQGHCSLCRELFTLFNRRHHCRACLQLVCDACSKSKALIADAQGNQSPQRVCDTCSIPSHTTSFEVRVGSCAGLNVDDTHHQIYCVLSYGPKRVGNTTVRNTDDGCAEWDESFRFGVGAQEAARVHSTTLYVSVMEKARRMGAVYDEMVGYFRVELGQLMRQAAAAATPPGPGQGQGQGQGSAGSASMDTEFDVLTPFDHYQWSSEAPQCPYPFIPTPSTTPLTTHPVSSHPQRMVPHGTVRLHITCLFPPGGSRPSDDGGGDDDDDEGGAGPSGTRVWRVPHCDPRTTPMHAHGGTLLRYMASCTYPELEDELFLRYGEARECVMPHGEVLLEIMAGMRVTIAKHTEDFCCEHGTLLLTTHRLIYMVEAWVTPLVVPLASITSTGLRRAPGQSGGVELTVSLCNALCYVFTQSHTSDIERRLHWLQGEVHWLVEEDRFAMCGSGGQHQYQHQQPPGAEDANRDHHFLRGILLKEYERFGLTAPSTPLHRAHPHSGAAASPRSPAQQDSSVRQAWRLSSVNEGFGACETYPAHIVVPNTVTDNDILAGVKWRAKRRIPTVVYIHGETKAPLLRSSQPKFGMAMIQSGCPEDERLLMSVRDATIRCVALASPAPLVMQQQPPYETRRSHHERALSTASSAGGSGAEDEEDGRARGISDDWTIVHVPHPRESVVGYHRVLRIIDARPWQNAKANVAIGKGHEILSRLGGEDCASLAFMNIANIHVMRESYALLRAACVCAFVHRYRCAGRGAEAGVPRPPSASLTRTTATGGVGGGIKRGAVGDHRTVGNASVRAAAGASNAATKPTPAGTSGASTARTNGSGVSKGVSKGGSNGSSNGGTAMAAPAPSRAHWYEGVLESKWFMHLSTILNGAARAAHHLSAGEPVLVHCSDGWDRTTQLTSLAQFMVDPFYRTISGFRILVQKEWQCFGHRFNSRASPLTSDSSESSPVFTQFLDCVYQITVQHPRACEFNALLLVVLHHASTSRFWADFLHNSQKDAEARERRQGTGPPSVSVWDHVLRYRERYTNTLWRTEGAESVDAGALLDMNVHCDALEVFERLHFPRGLVVPHVTRDRVVEDILAERELEIANLKQLLRLHGISLANPTAPLTAVIPGGGGGGSSDAGGGGNTGDAGGREETAEQQRRQEGEGVYEI